jgi:hypothetical protein
VGSVLATSSLVLVKGGAPFNKPDDVIDIRVETSIGMTARCHARVRYKLDDFPFKVGDLLAVKADTTVVFEGDVVSIGVEITNTGNEFTLTAYDKSYKLAQSTTQKAYLKSHYGDVLNALAKVADLKAQVDGKITSVVHDYLLQTSTNFDFLNDICLRTGSEWTVRNGKLIVGPRDDSQDSGVTLKAGVDLERLRARYSAYDDASEVNALGWDPKQKKTVTGKGADAAKATPSGGPPLFTGTQTDKVTATVKTGTLLSVNQDEASVVAAGLGRRLNSAQMIVRGETTYLQPTIVVGQTIKLDNVGPKLTGKYYVTAVEHVYGLGRSATTRFTAGGIEPSGVVDLLGKADTRVTPWSQLGVVVGIVTKNDQAADDPGKGYVRVKFPTIDDAIESALARIVVPEAGKNKGTYFVPSVDDEVLVAFEHGDVRRPYILGSVWNAKDTPPAVQNMVKDGKTKVRQIRTGAGHTMTFTDDDAPDKSSVIILLKDNKTTLKLTEKGVELVNDQQDIKIDNGQCSIVLMKNGDIQLKGKNIKIEASMKVSLAGQDIESAAKLQNVVKGSSTQIKAGAAAKVEAGGAVQIKGSVVQIN